MILSSLVCKLLTPWTFKVFLSPYGQQGERVKYDLFCMWSLSPMCRSLTHTQSRNLFPPWAAGKNVSFKVKGHWPRFDSIVTKTTKTKSGDHWEIKDGMVSKPHKAYRLHYFETHSLCLGNFKKTLNNLTSTKFVRFSTSFLSRDFLSISHITRLDKHL